MASGDTLARYTPLHNEPPSASAATLDTRNQHPVLDFDATNTEYGRVTDKMPRHYDGSGVTVYIDAAFSSATSGSAVWSIAWERIGIEVQDIDSDSFATAACVAMTAPSAAGLVAGASLSFADGSAMDSVAAGEDFRIEYARRPGDADDDASGDAELVSIELKET